MTWIDHPLTGEIALAILGIIGLLALWALANLLGLLKDMERAARRMARLHALYQAVIRARAPNKPARGYINPHGPQLPPMRREPNPGLRRGYPGRDGTERAPAGRATGPGKPGTA